MEVLIIVEFDLCFPLIVGNTDIGVGDHGLVDVFVLVWV